MVSLFLLSSCGTSPNDRSRSSASGVNNPPGLIPPQLSSSTVQTLLADLVGACYTRFIGSVDANNNRLYQSDHHMQRAFAVGIEGGLQYCAHAHASSQSQATDLALAECNRVMPSRSGCVLYATGNHIVYNRAVYLSQVAERERRKTTASQCRSSFANQPVQALCRWYWTSSDRTCSGVVFGLIRNGGLDVNDPRCRLQDQSTSNSPTQSSNLSTSANPAGQACIRKYQGVPTQAICNAFWRNEDQSCDNTFRAIITERGINLFGDTCRGLVPAATVVEPQSSSPAAGSGSAPKPAASRPAERGQATTAGKCERFINQIRSHSSPVAEACRIRYKSLQEETIACRRELTSFISQNSKGPGTSFESCGTR